jgi:3D (Asp-Asp-Asp) domain-containing protein
MLREKSPQFSRLHSNIYNYTGGRMKKIILGITTTVLVCIILSVMAIKLFPADRTFAATHDEPVATIDEPIATPEEAVTEPTNTIEPTTAPEEVTEPTTTIEVEPEPETEETEPTKPTKPKKDKDKGKENSEKPKPTNPSTPEEPKKEDSDEVYLGKFTLTAYCNCKKCCGKWAGGPTASGKMPKQGRTIAVDPKVIPLGSKVIINGETYIAEDTGSAIKNKKIDVYFDSHSEALDFGVQSAKVYLV